MSKSLSPTAQAILKAMYRSYDHEPTRRLIAADVLRTAAYRLIPPRPALDSCCEHWEQKIRHQFLSLAAELEELND